MNSILYSPNCSYCKNFINTIKQNNIPMNNFKLYDINNIQVPPNITIK